MGEPHTTARSTLWGVGGGLFPFSLPQTPCAWPHGPKAGAAKEALWGFLPGLRGKNSKGGVEPDVSVPE